MGEILEPGYTESEYCILWFLGLLNEVLKMGKRSRGAFARTLILRLRVYIETLWSVWRKVGIPRSRHGVTRFA